MSQTSVSCSHGRGTRFACGNRTTNPNGLCYKHAGSTGKLGSGGPTRLPETVNLATSGVANTQEQIDFHDLLQGSFPAANVAIITDVNGRITTVHKKNKLNKTDQKRLDRTKRAPMRYITEPPANQGYTTDLYARLGFSKSAVREFFDRNDSVMARKVMQGIISDLNDSSDLSDFARLTEDNYKSEVLNKLERALKPLMDTMEKADIPHRRRMAHVYVALASSPSIKRLDTYDVTKADKLLGYTPDAADALLEVTKYGLSWDELLQAQMSGIDLELMKKTKEGS